MGNWIIASEDDVEKTKELHTQGNVGPIEVGHFKGLSPTISGICRTCQFGMIFKRKARNDVVVLCDRYGHPQQVPTDIEVCNRYIKIGAMDLMEMRRAATIIEINRPLGFNKE